MALRRVNRESSFSQRLASATQGAMAMARKSKGPMAQSPMALAQGPMALAQAQIKNHSAGPKAMVYGLSVIGSLSRLPKPAGSP